MMCLVVSNGVKFDSPSSHIIVNTKFDSASESLICAMESSFLMNTCFFEIYSFSLHVYHPMVAMET